MAIVKSCGRGWGKRRDEPDDGVASAILGDAPSSRAVTSRTIADDPPDRRTPSTRGHPTVAPRSVGPLPPCAEDSRRPRAGESGARVSQGRPRRFNLIARLARTGWTVGIGGVGSRIVPSNFFSARREISRDPASDRPREPFVSRAPTFIVPSTRHVLFPPAYLR